MNKPETLPLTAAQLQAFGATQTTKGRAHTLLKSNPAPGTPTSPATASSVQARQEHSKDKAFEELWQMAMQRPFQVQEQGALQLSKETQESIANNPLAGPVLPPPVSSMIVPEKIRSIAQTISSNHGSDNISQRKGTRSWEELVAQLVEKNFKHQMKQISQEQQLRTLHDQVQHRIGLTEASMQIMRIRYEQLQTMIDLAQNIGRVVTEVTKDLPNRLFGTKSERTPVASDTGLEPLSIKPIHEARENLRTNIEQALQVSGRPHPVEQQSIYLSQVELQALETRYQAEKNMPAEERELHTLFNDKSPQAWYEKKHQDFQDSMQVNLMAKQANFDQELAKIDHQIHSTPDGEQKASLEQLRHDIQNKSDHIKQQIDEIAPLISHDALRVHESYEALAHLVLKLPQTDEMRIRVNQPGEPVRDPRMEDLQQNEFRLAICKAGGDFLSRNKLVPDKTSHPGRIHCVGQVLLDGASKIPFGDPQRRAIMDQLHQSFTTNGNDTKQLSALFLTDLGEMALKHPEIGPAWKDLLHSVQQASGNPREALTQLMGQPNASPIINRLCLWFHAENPEALLNKSADIKTHMKQAIADVNQPESSTMKENFFNLTKTKPKTKTYLDKYIDTIEMKSGHPEQHISVKLARTVEELFQSTANEDQPRTQRQFAHQSSTYQEIKENLLKQTQPTQHSERNPGRFQPMGEPQGSRPNAPSEQMMLEKLDCITQATQAVSHKPVHLNQMNRLHSWNNYLINQLNPKSLIQPFTQILQEFDANTSQGAEGLAASNRQQAVAMIEQKQQDIQAMNQLLQKLVVSIF